MKKEDLSKLSKPQLKARIAELTESLMGTYGMIRKELKPENRKKYRREIARLKTELNSRREK